MTHVDADANLNSPSPMYGLVTMVLASQAGLSLAALTSCRVRTVQHVRECRGRLVHTQNVSTTQREQENLPPVFRVNMKREQFEIYLTHPDWAAQNSTKITHGITHQELFPSGVKSGPGHHLPKIEVVMQHC